MSQIAENIAHVREQIAQAALRSGRRPEDITLVGVTKTVDVARMLEAAKAGVAHFGENRPQELRDKMPLVGGVTWHMIGQLQRNKVKYAVGQAELIHSVDSADLMDAINQQAAKVGCVQNVLIQLNLSGEATKAGICKDRLPYLLEHAPLCPYVRVKGLMTIGNPHATIEQNRQLFEICNNLFVDIQSKTHHNISMEILSMGMSGDFMHAIEAGSNLVRVGSGIFGLREYHKEGDTNE